SRQQARYSQLVAARGVEQGVEHRRGGGLVRFWCHMGTPERVARTAVHGCDYPYGCPDRQPRAVCDRLRRGRVRLPRRRRGVAEHNRQYGPEEHACVAALAECAEREPVLPCY